MANTIALPSSSREVRRRSVKLWSVVGVIAFWSVPALLVCAVTKAERPQLDWLRAFIALGLPWYFWAAATPVVLYLTRRWPIDASPRLHMILRHIAAGAFAGLLHGTITLSAMAITQVPWREDAPNEFVKVVFWMPFGLLFYGTTASVGFAVQYHRKLRERELLASRVEARLVEAQLGALRMQLQPHFLFNALNTVSMLIRQGEAQTAVRMLARLSDLLRQILEDGGPQEVPLEEELDLFARYLEIEQLRFGERLEIRVDVDGSARGAFVPTFLLQPLAENAIRHGIARRAAAGRIDLTAQREDGKLVVRLRNDGPSLPSGWSIETNTGIGLRNSSARLQHLYGAAGEITVFDAAEGGVEVRIALPYHTRPVPLPGADRV